MERVSEMLVYLVALLLVGPLVMVVMHYLKDHLKRRDYLARHRASALTADTTWTINGSRARTAVRSPIRPRNNPPRFLTPFLGQVSRVGSAHRLPQCGGRGPPYALKAISEPQRTRSAKRIDCSVLSEFSAFFAVETSIMAAASSE